MRLVQFRILNRILNNAVIPDYIHGFEKDKSIPAMAQHHVGKHTIISLDIKDFFPSIKQHMVARMFEALGVATDPAEILSELCTYKSYVPQGALTSPKVSNLIASGTFGPEIANYCKEHDLTLTIYADDITISFTKDFETREESQTFTRNVISFVTGSVSKFGFRINREKTKVMRPHMRQWVCGTVVNAKVNMRKSERAQLRAIVHNSSQNGVEAEAQKAGVTTEAFIRKYAGRINWLCQLNPEAGQSLKVAFKASSSLFLRRNPGVQIPELAWNSGIESFSEDYATEEVMQDTNVVQALSSVLNITPPTQPPEVSEAPF